MRLVFEGKGWAYGKGCYQVWVGERFVSKLEGVRDYCIGVY